eukprot:2727384-Prymnesium_polylepis.1
MAAGVMHARAGIAAVEPAIVPDIEVRASNRIRPSHDRTRARQNHAHAVPISLAGHDAARPGARAR